MTSSSWCGSVIAGVVGIAVTSMNSNTITSSH